MRKSTFVFSISVFTIFAVALFSLTAAAASDPHKDAVVRYFDLREKTLSTGGTASDIDKLLALLADDAKIEHPGPSIVMTKAQARDGMIAHLGEG